MMEAGAEGFVLAPDISDRAVAIWPAYKAGYLDNLASDAKPFGVGLHPWFCANSADDRPFQVQWPLDGDAVAPVHELCTGGW